MTIGERIKQRRIHLGYTVDELAQKIGKNRATVYRYESNDIENFPTTVLEPLSKALETTPAYLMGWDDDPTDGEEVANDNGICPPNDYEGTQKEWFNMKRVTDDDHYREEEEFFNFITRNGQFRSLAESYKILNEIGRQKACEYVSDLAEQPKYTAPTNTSADVQPFPTVVQESEPDYLKVNAAQTRTDQPVTQEDLDYDENLIQEYFRNKGESNL